MFEGNLDKWIIEDNKVRQSESVVEKYHRILRLPTCITTSLAEIRERQIKQKAVSIWSEINELANTKLHRVKTNHQENTLLVNSIVDFTNRCKHLQGEYLIAVQQGVFKNTNEKVDYTINQVIGFMKETIQKAAHSNEMKARFDSIAGHLAAA